MNLSELVRPPRLRPGDRVAAVTLSFGAAGAYPHRYRAGVRQIEETFGLRVTPTTHALRDPDWIAANPRARAEDLMEAFRDPEVRAVFSSIGGDDSVRILPFLDLEVLRANPKVFLGYSDTTVSHFACLRAGIASFYGPAVLAGFAENGGMFPYLEESVRRTLFEAAPPGAIEPNTDGWTVEFLDWAEPANQERARALVPSTGWRFLQGRGVAAGPLIGGCLEVLEFLKGTPWWPAPGAWDGAVLFLETSEEAPSPTQVRRCLRNYGVQGILQRASALLFGRPGGPLAPEEHAPYDDALVDVIGGELGLTELPVVSGMDFGHTDPMFVLPYGARAEVDCEARRLRIPEAAVV